MNKPFVKVKESTQYKRLYKEDYGHEKIDVLYQDEYLVIINKSNGLLSVPYPGSRVRTVLSVLEEKMRKEGTWKKNYRPFIVHRLDRDTSGIMMFALTEQAQKKIMATWHKMVTERLYHAVAENPVHGGLHEPLPDNGLIDAPLAQNAHNIGYVPQHNEEVKTVPARTYYKVLARGKTHTLFELNLDTGKKNQIRAHLASVGYPLAGDENYRAKTDPFHRLALHARTLTFVHPFTNKKMSFEEPEPELWLNVVRNGEENPQTPVWVHETERHHARGGHDHSRHESRKSSRQLNIEEKIVRKPTKKQLSKMDFMTRGKILHRGK